MLTTRNPSSVGVIDWRVGVLRPSERGCMTASGVLELSPAAIIAKFGAEAKRCFGVLAARRKKGTRREARPTSARHIDNYKATIREGTSGGGPT